ncbi:triose-phosphate isomerase [Anaerococcus sp. AGMB00486]|uniref:Triose-phosphate isomerase n=2 Tax=Anaerococcus TaxID=165779 RepID=A0ABX2NA74_9FIRM|nr:MULTISPECIES: triose-phosphate isomerase [Anaerococcus]MSS77741.1 triose-phosphate isomerase [Anaerococcus porci]NVF11596.1 triose-phosphate isomerase [Anaerococcus faecalis]
MIKKKPFFIFNPKSYLLRKETLELSKVANDLANKYKDIIDIYVTSPNIYLKELVDCFKYIKVSAQHIDQIELGRGMGRVVPETLKDIGVEATFLNHAEHQQSISDLSRSVKRAKQLGIITIVCADSIDEARSIATFNPDIILCEPTELIGTGKVSDESYINKTNSIIRKANKDVLIMQAAGISSAKDVYRTILMGADGTGCTSGIVKADNPKKMLKDMVESLVKAVKDRN